MTDYIASDWIENTGAVPAGVGPDTRIEVEYRDGGVEVWMPKTGPTDDPDVWSETRQILSSKRFRFLETPAERDARLLRGIGDLLDAGRIAEQSGRDE